MSARDWITVPLLGFAPDLPANSVGTFRQSRAVVPTDTGFGQTGYPSIVSTTLTGATLGGFVGMKPDGTTRIWSGTATKLYEYAPGGSGTTDRSGMAYSASATQTWSFAQFGNVTLAANKGNTIQAATTGSFADIAGAPKADIIVVGGLPSTTFVFAFNYIDPADASDHPDSIYWSAFGDYTQWDTTVGYGLGVRKGRQLLDESGPISAAIAFRNGIVAFKRNAMYFGQYIGAPDWWQFDRISGTVGCIGKNAVCEGDDVIYFADEFGLWYFDGAAPRPLPGALHDWWSAQVLAYAADQRNGVTARYDKRRHRVWFGLGYNGIGNGTLDYAVFNTRSQKWTEHSTFQNTLDGNTVAQMLSADYAVQSGTTPRFQTITWTDPTGPVVSGQITFAAHGNPSRVISATGFRPLWMKAPVGSSGWGTGEFLFADQMREVAGSTALVLTQNTDGSFSGVKGAKYLAPRLTVAAQYEWEAAEYMINLQVAGSQ